MKIVYQLLEDHEYAHIVETKRCEFKEGSKMTVKTENNEAPEKWNFISETYDVGIYKIATYRFELQPNEINIEESEEPSDNYDFDKYY